MAKKEKNNLILYPLSPLHDLSDEAEPYKEAWENIKSNSDIRNIAVTGDFGIGKSSILRSVADNKFRFVSVYGILGKAVDANWEYDLLTQLLLYGKGDDDCSLVPPKSQPVRTAVLVIFAILLSLCTFTLLHIGKVLETISQLPDTESSAASARFALNWISQNNAMITLIAYIILGILSLFGICTVVYLLSRRNLRLKNISVEVGHIKASAGKENKISCLDLYRPKLIELLANCNKTIIFEDMDRLDSKEYLPLMYRLHNLNRDANTWKYERNRCSVSRRIIWLGRYVATELNDKTSDSCFIKRLLTSKKTVSDYFSPVRFVYVVNDGIFCVPKAATGGDANRLATDDKDLISPAMKFFDYIIPAVPSLSSLNAAMYLANELEKVDFHNTDLINTVAPYLYDYRLANNILNEYQLMRNVELKRQEIDHLEEEAQTHLMALAIYKNLMPADYKGIRSNESTVFKPKNGVYDLNRNYTGNDCVSGLIKRNFLASESLHFLGYVTDKEIKSIFEGDDEEKKAMAFRLYKGECFRYFTWFPKHDCNVEAEKELEEQAEFIRALEEIDFAEAVNYNAVEREGFIENMKNIIEYLCVNGYSDFSWFCHRSNHAQDLRQDPEYLLKRNINNNVPNYHAYREFHRAFRAWNEP